MFFFSFLIVPEGLILKLFSWFCCGSNVRRPQILLRLSCSDEPQRAREPAREPLLGALLGTEGRMSVCPSVLLATWSRFATAGKKKKHRETVCFFSVEIFPALPASPSWLFPVEMWGRGGAAEDGGGGMWGRLCPGGAHPRDAPRKGGVQHLTSPSPPPRWRGELSARLRCLSALLSSCSAPVALSLCCARIPRVGKGEASREPRYLVHLLGSASGSSRVLFKEPK